MSASYGLQGIGGTRLFRDGNLGGQVIDTIPGGYNDALRLLRDRDFPQWNLALNLSYPIGASLADANYARAQITVRQTQAQIRALELQIATDVTNAGAARREQPEARRRGRAPRASWRSAGSRPKPSKFEVGLSTNFFVVQAQRDLAQAENIELRTRLDYQKSSSTSSASRKRRSVRPASAWSRPAPAPGARRSDAAVGWSDTPPHGQS